MKQHKVGRYIVLAIVGLIILVGGLVLTKLFPEANGIFKTLPFLCVGVGAGVFGGNIGTAIKNRTLRTNPQAAKQAEIEEKDERNRIIRDRAKSKAYDLMIFIYAAILLAFALIQVDIYIILALGAVYLFFVFSNVYYLSKYYQEM